MAKFEARAKVEAKICLELNEDEARWLAHVASFEHYAVLQKVHSVSGTCEVAPYGGANLLQSAREQLPKLLHGIDKARRVIAES